MLWFFICVAGALGACLGSFFNVVVYRVPRGESVSTPPSHCPSCGEGVRWYDNIPLISWVLLRGRCRFCASSISPRYLVLEVLGALSLVVPLLVGPWLFEGADVLERSLQIGLFALFSLPVIVIDWKHFLIPVNVVRVAAVLAFALSFIPGWISPAESALGALAGAAFLWLLSLGARWILGKEAMGGGDVELMLMIGAALGIKWVWFALPFASVLGLMLAGVVRIIPMAWRPSDDSGEVPDGAVPFGPSLCAGALLALCCSPELLRVYLSALNGG